MPEENVCINKKEEKKLDKEKRIKREISRLKSLLKKMEIDKKQVDCMRTLIENAAFMAITLDDLKNEINEEGTTSEYKNGVNQYGTKKSPAVETYNTMIKNYMIISKQIIDTFPEVKPKEAGDGFDEFVNDRG